MTASVAQNQTMRIKPGDGTSCTSHYREGVMETLMQLLYITGQDAQGHVTS